MLKGVVEGFETWTARRVSGGDATESKAADPVSVAVDRKIPVSTTIFSGKGISYWPWAIVSMG